MEPRQVGRPRLGDNTEVLSTANGQIVGPEAADRDVASCRAPSPLLIQYCEDDHLFPIEGMRAADQKIQAQYRHVGKPNAYGAQWYPGSHRFDLPMQESAFHWLAQVLTRQASAARSGSDETGPSRTGA